MWQSIKPGSTVALLKSKTSALGGMTMLAPTAVILLLSTRITWLFSTVPFITSIHFPALIAFNLVCAIAGMVASKTRTTIK